MNFVNKYIEVGDMGLPEYKSIVDDIHDFLKVPGKKKKSGERCRGNSLLEPAVFESYKHWDNPWAILNANLTIDMRILDCGSGRGVLQFYLSSKNYNIYSIDISNNRSSIIKKIKRKLNSFGIKYDIDPRTVHRKLNNKYKTNVDFKQESASELSFPDNYFDRVFSISVIEHMEDEVIENSITEMERVLKPGGLLLLTFDYHPNEDKNIIGFTADDFISKVLQKCNLKIVGNDPDFIINDWDKYIKEVNNYFKTINPNTSYGVVLKKI